MQRHVAEAAQLPQTSLYTDIAGTPQLRRELARHTAEAYGGEVAPADVLITAGCNQAFCLVLTALAAPGDNVVMPAPFYFNHQMWLAMQGIEVRSFSALDGKGGVPEPDRARACIDERTRAIVLVTPNNPTGAIFPPDTIGAFFALARQRGLALVIDETYRDFLEGGARPHGLFQDGEWRDGLVQLYSFSKVLRAYRLSRGLGDRRPGAHRSDREDHGLRVDLRAHDLPGRRLVRPARARAVDDGKARAHGGESRSAETGLRAAGIEVFADQRGGLLRLCQASVREERRREP